jgi:hypothetical protein
MDHSYYKISDLNFDSNSKVETIALDMDGLDISKFKFPKL